MTISPTKILAIVFGKTLKRKPIIKLGTTTLPVKEDTRYLGVILDQKLNFSKHINVSLEKARAQLNKILTLANRKYNIHPRKFKAYYNAIFLSIAAYVIQIFADEYKKVRNRRKALTVQRAVLRRMYRVYKATPVRSLQIVTDTPPLDLQIAIKAMKIQQDTDPNKHDEILQGRKLEEFLNDTWNDRWLETEKDQWTHEIYPDLRSRKKVDHDPTPEMVHFLTGHGPFAAKLAQT
ncbi:hypothetical protein HN011_012416 [Eciton burchellii]|nr:hypothetical protein HN011_012416 [Eciton burchellii]